MWTVRDFVWQKNLFFKAFTLLEVVIAMTLFFVVVTVVTVFFIQLVKVKWGQQARQHLIQESYFLVEKLQMMSRNYSIDYEEYFNRKQVGCTFLWGSGFVWDSGIWWYCSLFTAYGNYNAIVDQWSSSTTSHHRYYYCSSRDASPSWSYTSTLENGVYRVQDNIDRSQGDICAEKASQELLLQWTGYQSYGQYALQFVDVKDDADLILGALHDDDDQDMGMGPIALAWSWEVTELYLISHDEQHRLYIRRKLIEQGDRDGDGLTWGNDNEKLYTLQMLQLRWFDAGADHTFSLATSSGVYDGQVDTWACDRAAGFICQWVNVGGAYSGFHLPVDSEDWWVNIFPSDITISDWHMSLSPSKDPHMAWAEDSYQISPFVHIGFTTKLYAKNRLSQISSWEMGVYSVHLQTTLALPQL